MTELATKRTSVAVAELNVDAHDEDARVGSADGAIAAVVVVVDAASTWKRRMRRIATD